MVFLHPEYCYTWEYLAPVYSEVYRLSDSLKFVFFFFLILQWFIIFLHVSVGSVLAKYLASSTSKVMTVLRSVWLFGNLCLKDLGSETIPNLWDAFWLPFCRAGPKWERKQRYKFIFKYPIFTCLPLRSSHVCICLSGAVVFVWEAIACSFAGTGPNK